jgi:hypothetical protein
MTETVSRYRREGDFTLIEISLNTVRQLFTSLDPAPFREKDLDDEAEAYIVAATREFALAAPLKLVFHFPDDQARVADDVDLAGSVHGYFEYRLWATQRQLALLLRNGWVSLAIGLAFLFASIGVRQILLADVTGTVAHIVGEGLLISGWVAMWRPLQIFLYDWWPLRQTARVYAKLSRIPIEIRPTPAR